MPLPQAVRLIIEKIKDNFNRGHEFNHKKYTLGYIMLEDVRELSRYISGKTKTLEIQIPDIEISRNDIIDMQNKIMSLDPQKRKA
jgi:hypothetical protein